jgi:hypothetical protein
MANKKAYTAAQIIEALGQAEGFISQAAALLKCTPQTIYNYRDRYASVREALIEAEEKRGDFVESRLLKAIKEDNVAAIIFYCKTKLKGRGYIERQEVTGANGAPVVISVSWDETASDQEDSN